MFQLDPRLQKDTIFITSLPLSDALLMNDARYPWVILVPRKAGLTEVYQLNEQEQQLLMRESSFVAKTLAEIVTADKMNVAAIGNVVAQLHVHHVARFQQDETWPAPVWGKGEAVAYTADEQQAVISQLQQAFALFSHGNNA